MDKTFFLSVVLLVIAGFFIFSSASLGLLAREGISYTTVALKQFLIGFVFGGLTLVVMARIPYAFWKKNSLAIFLTSVVACFLVLVPHIGIAHGGARRWLPLGPYSFQPSEFLKLGVIIYFAAWATAAKNKIETFSYGLLPLLVIIILTGGLIMKQPDTGTFMVIFSALIVMFFVAGGKIKHILLLFFILAIAVGGLAYTRPYLMSRFTTFLDPSSDSLGSGYQIQQSLIAVGSGEMFGRGFGQSIQKFNFLPEPIGDSIFAVMAEEFGFVGSATLIILFVFFALRGYRVAARTTDQFGMLLATGIVTLIIVQSMINIGSMLGVMPLTGIPLIFVSQGGTAMLFGLAEVGIVLNISKGKKS